MAFSIVGTTIDIYRITAVLGHGGFGVVYKAEDILLETPVALKVIDGRWAHNPNVLSRLRSGAQALARLHHPNIVAIHSLRETDSGFFLVMEFVQGETLQEKIRRDGPMPLQEMKRIFGQILMALKHAHNVGIIHRDIKTSNVMLAKGNHVRITDFDLAKIILPGDPNKTVVTGGTVHYMSPEQVTGLGNVDKRGDIYSIGMTLYETVAGRLPFSATDSEYVIQNLVVEGKIPPVSEINPTLQKDLVRLVMKAINKDPAKRFQSVAEMLHALQNLQPEQKSVPRPRPRKSPRASHVSVWAAILGLLLMPVNIDTVRERNADLTIVTSPAEASVKVNGVEMGRTPLQSYRLTSGKARVWVEKVNYMPVDTSFWLESGEYFTTTLTLNPR